MPRGLLKASAYYNNIEAWKDWRNIAEQARQMGRQDLVEKFQPPEGSGWRKVDKAIAKLREAIAEAMAG